MDAPDNRPLESVETAWLETHLASLRREIAGRRDTDLRLAAKLAIVAGDEALEQGDLRHAALHCLTAGFLIDAARSHGPPADPPA